MKKIDIHFYLFMLVIMFKNEIFLGDFFFLNYQFNILVILVFLDFECQK